MFKFIAIFILVYFTFKYFRYLLKLAWGGSQRGNLFEREPESNIKVNKTPGKERRSSGVGEYIDFEELD